MAYLGAQPNKTLTKTTSQSFNGTGSATVFTLNRAVNTGEELEVFVENVQQEPGSGKSYTASGTTLTFDAAPPSGTGNIYVIYRGQAEVTTRLEHDANQALSATTGTFSGAVSATNGTFTGDLTVDTNTLKVDATNNRVGIGVTPERQLHVEGSGAEISLVDTQRTSGSRTANMFIDASDRTNLRMMNDAMDSASVAIRFDSSGRVTLPSLPRFRARNSGITNYTSVGDMSWGVEDFDVGNNFSGATFTCPIDGVYFFSFNVFANTGHSANIDLLHNGGIIGRSERGVSDGGYETIGLTLIFSCSTNDTVKMKLNSGQVHTNGTLNYFTGYLIG